MKTLAEHIATLQEPYRSAADIELGRFPNKAKMKFKSLKWALVWALPAGSLKYNSFWSKSPYGAHHNGSL